MPFMDKNSKVPTKGKGSKLSPKMALFVDEYLVDLNASAAVLRAGYQTRNQNRIAAELLAHPLVSAEIERRTQDRREKMELKADYLINKLINLMEKESIKDGDLIRAIELAGKSLALWKDRQEISGPDGEAIKMEQKVQENVSDFTRKLSRLAAVPGAGSPPVPVNSGREGKA
jgi:hypothetical protein